MSREPQKDIVEAAAVLKKGGVIVYPTETVYGLGGNALEDCVVRKVLHIKGRKEEKGLIVLVKDFKTVQELCRVEGFETLLRRYWPGPLTGIFKVRRDFPEGVGKGGTLAIRLSSHPLVRSLIELFDFPLISTSANRSGDSACLSIGEVRSSLDNTYQLVDFVIDGGELAPSPPSTLVDFAVSPPRILRHGTLVITNEDLMLR